MPCVNSPSDILGEYGGCQAVSSVVRLLDHILVVLELDDNTDRSKDLLTDNLHVGLAIGKDGGLNEVPFIAMTIATEVACSAI